MKKSFRDLYVWTASVDVALHVITLADSLIERRRYALADQLTRAAISVPSNIAEGHGRLTKKDWRHFLSQARGSVYELETQLEIATRANLIQRDEQLEGQIAKIGIGLTRLIASIKIN